MGLREQRLFQNHVPDLASAWFSCFQPADLASSLECSRMGTADYHGHLKGVPRKTILTCQKPFWERLSSGRYITGICSPAKPMSNFSGIEHDVIEHFCEPWCAIIEKSVGVAPDCDYYHLVRNRCAFIILVQVEYSWQKLDHVEVSCRPDAPLSR